MHCLAPSPWQAPPTFLVQGIIDSLLRSEPRWGLLVACLRLVSRGWRDAVAEHLPALAPRPRMPANEAAAMAARFPGLRLLRLQPPAPTSASAVEECAEEQAAALAAVCASCTALTALCLKQWGRLRMPALACLPALQQQRRLDLNAIQPSGRGYLFLDAQAEAALAQLPALSSLTVDCESTAAEGIGGLSQLTALELHAGAGLPAGAVAGIAAQLTRLHRLRLARLGSQAWAELPLLTALRQLSSLGLEVEGVKPVVSFSVGLSTVLPLLPSGGGTLRRLELVCFDGSVEAPPLAPLAGLEALDIAVPLQFDAPDQVSSLTSLTALDLYIDDPADGDDEEEEEEEEEGQIAAPVVAAIGRWLTGLRQLRLPPLDRVFENTLATLSGLQQLTALDLPYAQTFGGHALAALQPLRQLQRLLIFDSALDAASLYSALADSALAAAAAEGGATANRTEGEPLFLPELCPAVTFLHLRECRLLGPSSFVQLVRSFPALRRLEHRGQPQLQWQHLHEVLQGCPRLQLLQTEWGPSAAPTDGAAQQAQQAHANEQAFCRAWRQKLQYGLPSAYWGPHSDDHFEFDAAEELQAA